MHNKLRFLTAFLVIVEIILIGMFVTRDGEFLLLDPQGYIAREQRNVMFLAMGIMLAVAIPMVFSLYFFANKYKDTPKKHHSPDETHYGILIQFFWWAIPSVVVFVLALITWNKTHALDPYKPLDSLTDPVEIQVVALQWKWLFLYPKYKIATVNFIQIPEKTPVNFELTADAPMNAFWIPALSGQIYAMTGMSTKLHVISDNTGEYRGQAGEINGRGFSKMNFAVKASSGEDFESWVSTVKNSNNSLDFEAYSSLASPSENSPVLLYGSYEDGLYEKIIAQFMQPADKKNHTIKH